MNNEKGVGYKRSPSQIVLVVLFIFVSLHRLFGLDVFMTADEYLWIHRSRNFLVFLAEGNWSRTFQTGHPGLMPLAVVCGPSTVDLKGSVNGLHG